MVVKYQFQIQKEMYMYCPTVESRWINSFQNLLFRYLISFITAPGKGIGCVD
jgi:hypothetical protein